jgi:hypothetical protein
MITEKDFKRIGDAFDVHPRADEKYFELAKKMAIEFVKWATENKYTIVYSESWGLSGGTFHWWWYEKMERPNKENTFSSEQLFELYQQSKV